MKDTFKVIFTFLLTVIIATYSFEYCLKYLNYPYDILDHSTEYPSECIEKNNLILSSENEINNLLHDGGFRNLKYAQNKDGFQNILLDTLCLNTRSIRDYEKMIRIIPFDNETYKFNNLGYRGKDWTSSENLNTEKVFILGGSTAFSLLSSERDSIHNNLEKYLNKESKSKVYQVYNASFPGASSHDEFRTLSEKLIKYNPDIVIFITGYNNAGSYPNEYYSKLKNYFFSPNIIERTINLLISLKLEKISFLFKISNYNISSETINTVDSFISNTTNSKRYCISKDIKCIFVLQPTLLVQKKSLTMSEKKIRESHFNTGINKISSDFERSYNKFNDHFKKNEFNYLNLSDLGNSSNYNDFLKSNKSIKISELDKLRKIKLIPSNSKDQQSLNIDISKFKYISKERCNKMSLSFEIINNKLEYECLINEKNQFSSSILNFKDYKLNSNNVNKPILYSSNYDFYTFKLDFFSNINQLDLNIEIANEENLDDQILKAYISKDNNEYYNVKEVKLKFDEKNAEFSWDLSDKTYDTLFVKIELKNNYLKGINSIKYAIKKNEKNFLENKNILYIKNNSKDELFIDSIPLYNKEIFIDSAHLSDLGNIEMAEKIASKINTLKLN